ncbi:MAG: UTP--glucose-1-phosphate uridylyltransferase [Fibrobacteraceae bacterium]|nr:UTP--glucose-1-phosphate uridylyltransferase [Fibrobacteraceae bacterium]
MASIDFDLLKKLYAQFSRTEESSKTPDILEPMPFAMAEDDRRYEMWEETGKILLSKGEVAAFTIAGGQGSRLGFEGPKGAYDFGLPSHASLFRLEARRLLNLGAKAEHPIPWAIMTSPLNRKATIEHFEEHSYFGYNKDSIRFFDQGMLCALTPEGEPVKDKNGNYAEVPDGNGGCFRALAISGTLAWFVEKGVRFVFLANVDNALVKMCDPAFIGFLASNGNAPCAVKVVHKRNAQEKVGIFAFKNSKPTVVEYTDISDELRNKTFEDGTLAFDGGNIGIYAFRTDALRKISTMELPWHAARKKVEDIENCWKFEQFLFDAFPLIGQILPYGVEREDDFAPVKNMTGNDSPATARQMLGMLHRSWLEKAKVTLKPRTLYEISPRLTYAGENLSQEIFDRELGRGIFEFPA